MKESMYLLSLALDDKLTQEKIIEEQAEVYLSVFKDMQAKEIE